MANIDIERSYNDGEVLFENDLDNIKDGIETFLNGTRINDDNIQTSGITGSTKLVDASVTTAKLADGAITGVKLQDAAITTDKIASLTIENEKVALNAVTNAKLTTLSSKATPGMTITFHTFNGAIPIPRGWMKCNGDTVDQTNYDAIHGSGAYTSDGISSSSLLNKNLPDMVDKYAIGVAATTQDGTAPITSVGNADNQIDFSHTHTIGSHTHGTIPLDYSGTERSGAATDSGSFNLVRYDALGNATGTLATEGSATLAINPESIEEIFIMKVI